MKRETGIISKIRIWVKTHPIPSMILIGALAWAIVGGLLVNNVNKFQQGNLPAKIAKEQTPYANPEADKLTIVNLNSFLIVGTNGYNGFGEAIAKVDWESLWKEIRPITWGSAGSCRRHLRRHTR